MSPKRGGKRHNVSSAIKNVFDSLPENNLSLWPTRFDYRRPQPNRDHTNNLSDAIAYKMEDGNIRATVSLALFRLPGGLLHTGYIG